MYKNILQYNELKPCMKCTKCRHSNQGTCDAKEGLIFCAFDNAIHFIDSNCTLNYGGYFLFEEYDGTTCSWGSNEDFTFIVPSECNHIHVVTKLEENE